LCPAFRANNHTPQDRQRVADGWWKYYRVKMDPKDIYCDGCLADDASEPKLVTADCAIRPCAAGKGIPNCAHCDEYVCDTLAGMIVDNSEKAARRGEMSDYDYQHFVRSYDNKRRLAEIRQDLAGKESGDEGE
jgi:hypothetical protein